MVGFVVEAACKRFAVLADRVETQGRTHRGLMYRFFGEIADLPDESAMVPALVISLAARLRIAPPRVTRRRKVAARIRPRPPPWPDAGTGPPGNEEE